MDHTTTASLTPTAAIVLGLVEAAGPATPYELKAMVARSIGNFWSVPHSALYAEPERLAAAGLLEAHRERSGRRRRTYALSARGAEALARWRGEPAAELPELRDLALLKVFFGADPAAIAPARIAAHREKLAHYGAIRAEDGGEGPRGPFLALEAGIVHEHEWIAYWERLAGEATG